MSGSGGLPGSPEGTTSGSGSGSAGVVVMTTGLLPRLGSLHTPPSPSGRHQAGGSGQSGRTADGARSLPRGQSHGRRGPPPLGGVGHRSLEPVVRRCLGRSFRSPACLTWRSGWTERASQPATTPARGRLVRRAEALTRDDLEGVAALATTFDELGAAHQRDRCRHLAG